MARFSCHQPELWRLLSGLVSLSSERVNCRLVARWEDGCSLGMRCVFVYWRERRSTRCPIAAITRLTNALSVCCLGSHEPDYGMGPISRRLLGCHAFVSCSYPTVRPNATTDSHRCDEICCHTWPLRVSEVNTRRSCSLGGLQEAITRRVRA
jgi:hypothetical protein